MSSTDVTRPPDTSPPLTQRQIRLINSLGIDRKIFKEVCNASGVASHVACALIFAENNHGGPSIRFEPGYRWLKDPIKWATEQNVSLVTEENMQRFSYGPMQIMGATARDIGYEGFLPDLMIPVRGLSWGLQYFKRLQMKYPKIEDAVSAYNQGSPKKRLLSNKYKNQDYVDKVMGFITGFFEDARKG